METVVMGSSPSQGRFPDPYHNGAVLFWGTGPGKRP